MSYRNLLISPENPRQVSLLVRIANRLVADSDAARIVGAHHSSRLHAHAHGERCVGIPGAGYDHELHEHVRAMADAFTDATADLDVPCSWRTLHGEDPDHDAAITEVACCFDLAIVAGDPDSGHPAALAARLALDGGAPVLYLPSDWSDDRVPQRVLIAWNASRESCRAAFDALPILQQAAFVEIAWFDDSKPDGNKSPRALAPVLARQFFASLNLHGVAPAVDNLRTRAPPQDAEGQAEPGDVSSLADRLIERLQALECDLLVIGAQGATGRARGELGDLASMMLDRSRVPVLLS